MAVENLVNVGTNGQTVVYNDAIQCPNVKTEPTLLEQMCLACSRALFQVYGLRLSGTKGYTLALVICQTVLETAHSNCGGVSMSLIVQV